MGGSLAPQATVPTPVCEKPELGETGVVDVAGAGPELDGLVAVAGPRLAGPELAGIKLGALLTCLIPVPGRGGPDDVILDGPPVASSPEVGGPPAALSGWAMGGADVGVMNGLVTAGVDLVVTVGGVGGSVVAATAKEEKISFTFRLVKKRE